MTNKLDTTARRIGACVLVAAVTQFTVGVLYGVSGSMAFGFLGAIPVALATCLYGVPGALLSAVVVAAADTIMVPMVHPSRIPELPQLAAVALSSCMTVGLAVACVKHLYDQLREAEKQVAALRRLLPICSNCKSIRSDTGHWHRLEQYMGDHADVTFSHGLCESCAEELYPEIVARKREGQAERRRNALAQGMGKQAAA